MQLTKKLLSFFHRVFKKDPEPFLALRFAYNGNSMTWRVQDGILTTTVSGGPGSNLSVDLSQFTVYSLAAYLGIQPGYSILFLDTSELSRLSALVLMDGSGDPSQSNGDHLYGYTSVLWTYLEAASKELKDAGDAIAQMLLQMSTKTAGDAWLDELGGYYGVPRLQGETDVAYGPRIIAEVLRPRSNNIAIAEAITYYTGQATTVIDYVGYDGVAPLHDGTISYNGAHTYNSTAKIQYGKFDVTYGYDLENGGSFADFQSAVTSLLGRLRAAGTQLNSLLLTGGAMQDIATNPTDSAPLLFFVVPSLADSLDNAPIDDTMGMQGVMPLTDAVTNADDTNGISLTISAHFLYNGVRTYDGSFTHLGTTPYTETI